MRAPLLYLGTMMMTAVRAFSPLSRQVAVQQGRHYFRPATISSLLESTTESASVEQQESTNDDDDVIETSTMTLLEHVNINVPSHEYILPFYYDILGMGMDPRKAANLNYQQTGGKKTLWANCGASQFHLPYGETAQTIPGHIGLQYPTKQSLQDLEARLQANPGAYERYEKGQDKQSGNEFIRIVDKYGNQFYCRVSASRVDPAWKQPIIGVEPADVEKWGEDVVRRFGRKSSACAGIQYVEFSCPVGTADKIALFYDSVLDATTSVVHDETTGKVAVIAFGKITSQGQADQTLLFRETTQTLPPYDGHHIALYVGQSGADFEQAFQNAELAGVVWVNPRFSDKADTLQGAKQWKQFRFKDIVDMDTGKLIFELEHEVRSVDHEAWPGRRNDDQ